MYPLNDDRRDRNRFTESKNSPLYHDIPIGRSFPQFRSEYDSILQFDHRGRALRKRPVNSANSQPPIIEDSRFQDRYSANGRFPRRKNGEDSYGLGFSVRTPRLVEKLPNGSQGPVSPGFATRDAQAENFVNSHADAFTFERSRRPYVYSSGGDDGRSDRELESDSKSQARMDEPRIPPRNLYHNGESHSTSFPHELLESVSYPCSHTDSNYESRMESPPARSEPLISRRTRVVEPSADVRRKHVSYYNNCDHHLGYSLNSFNASVRAHPHSEYDNVSQVRRTCLDPRDRRSGFTRT